MRRAIEVVIASQVALIACTNPAPPTGHVYVHRDGEAIRVRPDGTDEQRVGHGWVTSAGRNAIFLIRDDDIYVAEPDGTNLRALASAEGFDWYPKLNRGQVLFESSRASFRDLYVVPFQGGEPVRLTNDREGNFDASWSPDGAQIAFSSSRYGQLDLFVMDANGTNVRRLTHHPGDAIKPAFSRDGTTIAFISRRDGKDDLFTVGVDGKGIRNLTRSLVGEVLSFDWSKSGIVFGVRRGRGEFFIHAADAATAELSSLGEGTDPVWSPRGTHVAFTHAEDVWIMRADGEKRVRIARNAWLPRWLEVQGSKQ